MSLGAGYVLAIAPTTLTVQTQKRPVQMAGAMMLVLEKDRTGGSAAIVPPWEGGSGWTTSAGCRTLK